jgi:hypothetical protein
MRCGTAGTPPRCRRRCLAISPHCGDTWRRAEQRRLVSRQRPLDGGCVALAGGVAASSWTAGGAAERAL